REMAADWPAVGLPAGFEEEVVDAGGGAVDLPAAGEDGLVGEVPAGREGCLVVKDGRDGHGRTGTGMDLEGAHGWAPAAVAAVLTAVSKASASSRRCCQEWRRAWSMSSATSR